MKAVFISVDSAINREKNLEKTLANAGIEKRLSFELGRHPNGKPKLEFSPPRRVGYSVSHVAIGGRKMEALALLDEGCDIGLDVELWPQGEADPAFVDTISTPEDVKALRMLASGNHDAGVALWVVKESALKCTGEVMTDPRNLAVAHLHANLFRVQSSAGASSPHAEIDVSLHVLTQRKAPHSVLLLGLAMGAGSLTENRQARAIHFDANDWNAAEFGRH